MEVKEFAVQSGDWQRCGAIPVEGGVNFCVFTRHATHVELLLFESADSVEPFQVITLGPRKHRTFFFWHIMVEALPVGTWYAWRADGPTETRTMGTRFDPGKVLLDPWAKTVSDIAWDRRKARSRGSNLGYSMLACVVGEEYDWEGDEPITLPTRDAIIYEMHLGGFTRHSSSGVKAPGTFAALVEKIPYLKDLGITHVELMPVIAFDTQDLPDHTASLGLENYWGYSTHSFFAPHPHYSSSPHAARDEFRDMVKALHKAGIGVILDVVLNHTAEGGADGPTINFKGLGNEMFYHLDTIDKRIYRDYTGCGNTVNSNHPIVARFLIDCLEYWVREMHVDGFRFDLASALARGEDGNPHHHAPVLWNIELSEVLSHTPIIAEAWDASGLYQVGDFPGFRWREWNGRYRDSIRGFVRGDRGNLGEVATRLAGSSDMYQPKNRLPTNSINFVTCHDGFTLYDLVSYEEKHNEANGEDNRDGHDYNLSANYGVEGATEDPVINALRERQARNFIAILLLSQGIPMLLAGDEVLRSQQGNNNGYCQNNELSWFDWRLVEKNSDMHSFVKSMIAFRKRHACLRRKNFLTGEREDRQDIADVRWYGPRLEDPPWSDPEAQAFAFTLAGVTRDDPDLHLMLNMSVDPVDFVPPSIPGRRWGKSIDTSVSPSFIAERDVGAVAVGACRVAGRSIVVLESRRDA